MVLLEEKWEEIALRKNEELIAYLKIRKAITDKRIEMALRRMPRHRFLATFSSGYGYYDLAKNEDLEAGLRAAYSDDALMLSWGVEETPMASISQPSIVVEMLQELELKEGQKVLEIGTGTGWNAALIASIVGVNGRVTTVEVSDELAEKARERIFAYELGEVVSVVCGDGRLGAEQNAPYDRIICTAGADKLYFSWIKQLKVNGILVLPTDGSQDFCPMLRIERGVDRLHVKTLTLARFVPLVPKRREEPEPEGIDVVELLRAAEKQSGILRLKMPE